MQTQHVCCDKRDQCHLQHASEGFEPAEKEDHTLCAAQSSATLCGRTLHLLIVAEMLESVQKVLNVQRFEDDAIFVYEDT